MSHQGTDAPSPAGATVGQWSFEPGAEGHDNGLADGIAQNGVFLHGASANDGALELDGSAGQFVIAGPDAPFDIAAGRIEATFVQDALSALPQQTIVSRGLFNAPDGRYFDIHLTNEGSVGATHQDTAAQADFATPDGFASPGDSVRVIYEWSPQGARLHTENLTTGQTDDHAIAVQGLSFENPALAGTSFVIGARSLADGGTIKHFDGRIEAVSVQDKTSGSDGIVDGTTFADLIDADYLGDPDGDRIDAADARDPGAGPDDDHVRAGGGNDVVHSGQGDDLVDGGAGHDDILAGPGNDTVLGGDGSDDIIAGQGSDLVYGGDGYDVIDTGAPGISLPDLGFPGFEGVPAIPADDDPYNDRDTVYGGDGDDTIRTGDDADSIFGGAGRDRIDGGIDADTISGNDGDDFLIGGEGSDVLLGAAGDDTLYGGLGPGTADRFSIPDIAGDRPPDPRANNGRDTIEGGDGADLIFGQDDADLLRGGNGDDTLDGGIDDDHLVGGAGNDVLRGGAGADVMQGGADRDIFVGAGAGDVIDGGEGSSADPSDDYDTLDLSQFLDGLGPGSRVTVTREPGNVENGNAVFEAADGAPAGSLTFQNIETVVICFSPQTLIATPRGLCPVGTLRPGDRVITRDNGLQPICWSGRRDLTQGQLQRAPHLLPIRIRAGALGPGQPERDILVSPNHRMLVNSERAALYFEEREVLIAAKHLTGRPGVEVLETAAISYVHVMCERHEVLLADGAWSESFQPGDHSLNGIGAPQRREILDLFPELAGANGIEGFQSARRSLRRHEAAMLLRGDAA